MMNRETTAVISVRGLIKDYSGHFWEKRARVLHGIDFSVPRGALYGFLGPNGAGKTTTIKILLDLLRPTAGEVQVLGGSPWAVSVKSRLGYLPESPYFYDYLSGREWLHFCGRLFELPLRLRRERVESLLRQVGLSEAADLSLRKYSKGMLQRIGVAQALINDPELVILDEPMSGLDPIGRHEMRELILGLQGQGKTVFFSTHILSDAEELCQEVAILVKGRVADSGPLQKLLARELAAVEVEVSGIAEDALHGYCRGKGLPLQRLSQHFGITCTEEGAVEPLLRYLFEQKGRLIGVRPLRRRLEELFVRQVREGEGK